MIKLKRAPFPEAFLDAEILLSHILKKDRAWLLAHNNKTITKQQARLCQKLITKRAKWWPIAYLIGEKYFYGKKFTVNKDVLVPRPESESIVELVLDKINNSHKTFSLIDIGTGSGCLIISILLNEKAKKINKAIAIDISDQALRVAKTNAKHHKLAKKIKFIKNDLLKDVYFEADSKTDELIILANLPYLTKEQMAEPSIKHEPRLALLAKQDGLALYRELKKQLASIKEYYTKPITLICEINPGQKDNFKTIWPQTKFVKDLSGKIRLGMIKL